MLRPSTRCQSRSQRLQICLEPFSFKPLRRSDMDVFWARPRSEDRSRIPRFDRCRNEGQTERRALSVSGVPVPRFLEVGNCLQCRRRRLSASALFVFQPPANLRDEPSVVGGSCRFARGSGACGGRAKCQRGLTPRLLQVLVSRLLISPPGRCAFSVFALAGRISTSD